MKASEHINETVFALELPTSVHGEDRIKIKVELGDPKHWRILLFSKLGFQYLLKLLSELAKISLSNRTLTRVVKTDNFVAMDAWCVRKWRSKLPISKKKCTYLAPLSRLVRLSINFNETFHYLLESKNQNSSWSFCSIGDQTWKNSKPAPRR